MFRWLFYAYIKVRKENGKGIRGKIFWADIIFYWSWNGDRNVDFGQRDHYCGRKYMSASWILFILQVNRCEENIFMPVLRYVLHMVGEGKKFKHKKKATQHLLCRFLKT